YDLLPRVPGLLVLHDLVLHHARARTFLDAPAVRAYAAEPARAVPRGAGALAPRAGRAAGRGAAGHGRRPVALRVPAVPAAGRGLARSGRAQRVHGRSPAGGRR